MAEPVTTVYRGMRVPEPVNPNLTRSRTFGAGYQPTQKLSSLVSNPEELFKYVSEHPTRWQSGEKSRLISTSTSKVATYPYAATLSKEVKPIYAKAEIPSRNILSNPSAIEKAAEAEGGFRKFLAEAQKGKYGFDIGGANRQEVVFAGRSPLALDPEMHSFPKVAAKARPMVPPSGLTADATVETFSGAKAGRNLLPSARRLGAALGEGAFSVGGSALRGAGRLAGRFAGPVGLAMTAYDLAQAFPAPAPISEKDMGKALRSYRTGPQPAY